jgi:CrcB protein
MQILLILMFGATGVLLRYLINQGVGVDSPYFFWSTISVNVTGSLLIGIFYAAQNSGSQMIPVSLYIPLMAGLLGGLTTFSGFSLDTLKLLQSGQAGMAIFNVGIQVFCSLGFCYLGMRCFPFFSKIL